MGLMYQRGAVWSIKCAAALSRVASCKCVDPASFLSFQKCDPSTVRRRTKTF
jgi:hypothetical protein